MPSAPTKLVSKAFTEQSVVFDELDKAPLIQWVRQRVRTAAMRWLKPGDELLDINCGTGIDSLWFAEQGVRVLATDDAPGMLAELERKRTRASHLPLRSQRCSFLELESLGSERFQVVFSNFGGLNCTADLPSVLRGVDHVLVPGGTCTLVIMPRFSPWELVDALRGNPTHAFRRYRRDGAPALVENTVFPCWYHDASVVTRTLKDYAVLDRSALSFFVPPPHLGPFAQRHPQFVRAMEQLEDLCCRWPFIRDRGDHYLITLRKPLRA